MEATNLMINDWVICYHPTCMPKQTQVTAGLLISLERQYLGFQKEESPLFRIVEPIPLTAEILEKNFGYKRKNKYYHITIENKYTRYCVEYDIESRKLTVNNVWFVINEVRYVHELQHALRLCGIEKNIEL